jgi:hypothetical protein
MLPPRSVPPFVGLPEIEMVKDAGEPGPNDAATLTVKRHGTPFFVQVPANMAVLPAIPSDKNDTLCTFAPVVRFTYCRPPLMR